MYKPLFVIAAISVLGSSALAETAFNNFDGDGGFSTGIGKTISGLSSVLATDYNQGSQFVSATTGDVVQITVALGYVTGTNAAIMNLYEDSGDKLGTLKGSWKISDMGAFGTAYTPTSIGVNPGVSLTAGNKYWLIADSADDAWLAWNWNNIGYTGRDYQSTNGAEDYFDASTAGAFRVETRPVPEPFSMIALASGLVALARRRK